jgi:uncharacterized membrane protein (UPF0127 family)
MGAWAGVAAPLVAQSQAPIPKAVAPGGREFRLELARTPQQRALGYMYRSRVGPDEGMLFLFEQSGFHSIWMKNCLVGLDVVWLSEDLRVVHLERSVPPCKADPCPGYPSMVKARYILEIAAGMAKKAKLNVGDEMKVVGVDLENPSPAQ